jgi:hypothetical protein
MRGQSICKRRSDSGVSLATKYQEYESAQQKSLRLVPLPKKIKRQEFNHQIKEGD